MASSIAVLPPPPTTLPAPITDSSISDNRFQIQLEPIFHNRNRWIEQLKSCRSLPEIKQIHGQFAKLGVLDDVAVLTKLIDKYSRLSSHESLEYALRAFRIFKDKGDDCNGGRSRMTFLYNTLIRGSSSAGMFHDAIFLYVEMLIDGIAPDSYTFPFVLSACGKGLRLSEGEQIHGDAVKLGFCNDVFVLNSLVYCYGECGETDIARKVFDEMPVRNVVSWTSLICGYARRDRHREAVSLFFEMVEEGIEPNEVTAVTVISACAKLRDLDLGKRIVECVGGSGLSTNHFMVNALVDMYMKCGAVYKARQLFDDCVDENLVLYNTLMSNYVKLGKVGEALNVFCKLLDVGLKPDRVTMLSVITASAELEESRFGMQSHAYVLRNGLEGWDSIGNSLIDMYAKCNRQEWGQRVFDQMPNKTVVSWNSLLAGFSRNGDMESARWTFNEMPEKDIVSWNSMIGALVQHSLFRDAIELFHSMQSERVMADEVTMVGVASACGYLGAWDLAKWIHNYIEKYSDCSNLRLGTALVDMFARCGDPQSAMKVFDNMKERDVSAWTAAIGAMAMEGNGERAVGLFHEMLMQGTVPDEVAFSAVLTACSRTGLVKQGMRIFDNMQEHGITPHIVHYGCVIDLLGRAGLLVEALEFINTMPMEPNSAIWGSFLAACRIHKNDKMATHAASMITKSANDETGIQVLLSNIYASAGKWDDVARVRTHMREQGMRKIPGTSSIEVDGVVHEFTCGDESHPLTASMLEELNCRLRDAGYVPDLDNVLVDVDMGEKGVLLSRHSEKRAIAFGLVASGKGTPVRIIKNLRMCSDCHSFAKAVSKMYDREIVIRDNNRFHFFRQGWCSCNDFW